MLFMLFRACFLGMSTFLCTRRFANSLTYSKTLRIVRGRGKFHQFHSTSIETTSSIDFLGDTNRTVSMYPDAGKMKSMNLVELKVLLKTLGGSPGVLRKAEILALCDDLLRDRGVSIEKLNVREKSESKTSIAGNNIVPAKKPIRALSPILPGPKSVEQFQLPTIKGDVNQIGSRIVKDLGDMYAAKSNASVLNDPSDYDSSDFQPERDSTPRRNSYQPVNSIREYHMGNTSGSMEFKNLTTGQHYWAYHPTGAMRDERILEGYQPESGTSVGGPGSGLGDMDVTFLGTASCVPSLTRGVSCLAFRYNSCVWLVDCGEGSQQQMQKSRIRPSKITKIFITHLHGDHSFGLPGVLCLIGQSTMAERDKEKALRGPIDWSKQRPGAEDEHILDIYGPEGTRDYLRAVIQLSYSKVVHPYRIHELKDVPNLYVRPPRTPPPLPQVRTRSSGTYGERPGGLDIYPDKDGQYFLFEEDQLKVMAAPTEHTVPCVGYVITEKTKPGRLKVEDVTEAVNRNKKALAAKFNLRDPNKIFAVLKDMKPGSSLVFPDGTVMNADEILEPPRSGRKVVIMGDTCNSDMLAPIAMDADVIIHEATNAWIKDQDSARYPTEQDLEKETHKHGHSTPQMAGRFTKKIRARKLIMTHFSSRYRGDESEHSMKIMWRMEQMARRVTDLWGKNDIIAAWDQMCLPIRTREDEEEIAKKENALRAAVDLLAERGH